MLFATKTTLIKGQYLGELHEQIALGRIEKTVGGVAVSSAELLFSRYQLHVVRDL